jgi:hypothetical protein
LFVSPFIVVFAVTVFFLNHVRVPGIGATTKTRIDSLDIPSGIAEAEGPARVRLAALILSQAGVTGEIDFIRFFPKEHRLVIPVVKPGVETTIDVDLDHRTAIVSERRSSFWESLSYLHRSPGPHNAAIRGNWLWMRVWKWLADATVWLVLFLSVSGLYLWIAIRSERRTGLTLLVAGALSFAGIIYAMVA